MKRGGRKAVEGRLAAPMAGEKITPEENVVMVVVQAEREIPKTALSWALTHLVRPGDIVILLVVIPHQGQVQRRRPWSFPKFAGECGSGQGGGSPENRRKEEISAWCSRMALHLHDKGRDPQKVNVRIKVVAAEPPSGGRTGDAVAAEWRRVLASWIVLDRQLRDEARHCLQVIPDCSIVLMERNQAKVLRLNLRGRREKKLTAAAEGDDEVEEEEGDDDDEERINFGHGLLRQPTPTSGSEEERAPSSSSSVTKPKNIFPEPNAESPVLQVALSRSSSAAAPPPLCTVCRQKAPPFGKPPRWFVFWELEEATGGFCDKNLLAESGTSWVHRGMLRSGLVVAVKRMKAVVDHGDDGEFRAEVDVLSRAQHRNVVMLVGFCLEAAQRVLVYEYICNGTLAAYLHGGRAAPLDWPARLRIAIGAARGLRYLHEDCRVGFIHGDVRPSNILLTHDFQPLVTGFGFSRWRTEKTGNDSRTLGRFGYLAPECLEKGGITEKADVYAFGVVLLELLTGRRAVDRGRPKGQQFLAEWARPILSTIGSVGGVILERLLDPRLDPEHSRCFIYQVNAIAQAAAACLHRDPSSRPAMSKVLRMVEGAQSIDLGLSVGSLVNSTWRSTGQPRWISRSKERSLSQRLPHEAVLRALQHGDMRRGRVS